jgi:hypothetical protein
MEKLTYEQILEVLKSKLKEVEEFAYEDYDKEELGLGEIEEVDKYGGEGKGETWYSVKHFVDHNVYIRVDGYYTSYEGTSFYDEWDCCRNVKPEQKTITVYE